MLRAGGPHQYDSPGHVAVPLHPHVPAPPEPGPHGPVLPFRLHVSQGLRLPAGPTRPWPPPRPRAPGAPPGLNVTCTGSRLKEIPPDLPPDTAVLRLDHNQIMAVPDHAFRGLRLLRELNLSHNAVETLGEGAFSGVEATLQVLDLSHNRITSVHKDAFARLKARVLVDDNPWHCDCTLQQALGGMAHNHEAAARVLCRSSELQEQEGRHFLAVDTDLCNLAKRTTDYAMLVTMFGWFAMVISYVVYYVRQNQEDARRHLEYLKSLPSKPVKPNEVEDISTVV